MVEIVRAVDWRNKVLNALLEKTLYLKNIANGIIRILVMSP